MNISLAGQAEDAHDAEPRLLERRHQEHVQGEHPGQAEVQHCGQQVRGKGGELRKHVLNVLNVLKMECERESLKFN